MYIYMYLYRAPVVTTDDNKKECQPGAMEPSGSFCTICALHLPENETETETPSTKIAETFDTLAKAIYRGEPVPVIVNV
jgi:hypothetical protein